MMQQPAKRMGVTDTVAITDTSKALDAFLQPTCAAAIWHRQPDPIFQTWIDALEPEHLPRGRIILRRAEIREVLHKLCDAAKTPDHPERNWFIADATNLAERFADMMRATYLRLRLDAVTTNSCRKFHVDAITARLVCTYRGIGTQYGVSANGGDPARVFTVPTGAPILLRGSLWPPTPNAGLLHRSPPIEGTGETRLVLVLDPIFDPEDAV